MFADLTAEQRARLTRAATVDRYPRGTEVFAAGDRATSFFLVLSGQLKVYLLSPDGREHILHMAGHGDLVAEGAVFAQGTYPASAMAVADSSVARVYRDRLLQLLREDPELSLAMLGGLSRRLRQFVQTIEDLSLRDVTTRLARFVLAGATDGFCPLPGTKTQLAAQLGTVLEPLSRSLRHLKEAGILAERKGGVVVLDAEALQDLVDGL